MAQKRENTAAKKPKAKVQDLSPKKDAKGGGGPNRPSGGINRPSGGVYKPS